MSRNSSGQGVVERFPPQMGKAVARISGLCLAFLIVACATQDSTQPLEYDEARAERLFSVGYEDISSIYIDEVPISDLAIAGLDGLSRIDPAVAVVQGSHALTLYVDGVRSNRITVPRENDTAGWGQATASMITASRDRSGDIAAAEPEEIYEQIFLGMMTELDGFSRYAGRDVAQENRASRDGFGGIGVRIRLVEDGVLIMSVMEDTPAERSGLRKDDVIVAIDGSPVQGLSQREVVRRLRGSLRSTVELTVERPDEAELLVVDVVRSHIIPQTVAYEATEDGIAYIEVSGFNQNTTRSLQEKIELAREELGAGLAGFIVDLRDNPGGLLDQAISVSDLFIREGRILTTEGRHPDSHQYFEADKSDLTEGSPVILLVNGGSASASEIVAGALQDSGRAVVIGSVSFGKGTVQTLLRLPNRGELTLTWARFHTPSGYSLNRRGVLPDICTSGIGDTTLEELLDGVRNGTGLIDRELRTRHIPPDNDEDVLALRAHCPSNEERPELDIAVAKRILVEPELYARALHASGDTAGLAADSFPEN